MPPASAPSQSARAAALTSPGLIAPPTRLSLWSCAAAPARPLPAPTSRPSSPALPAAASSPQAGAMPSRTPVCSRDGPTAMPCRPARLAKPPAACCPTPAVWGSAKQCTGVQAGKWPAGRANASASAVTVSHAVSPGACDAAGRQLSSALLCWWPHPGVLGGHTGSGLTLHHALLQRCTWRPPRALHIARGQGIAYV